MQPAPLPGQHNFEIYGDVLGMSDEDIGKLMNNGVI